jgi:hypothetical protein
MPSSVIAVVVAELDFAPLAGAMVMTVIVVAGAGLFASTAGSARGGYGS